MLKALQIDPNKGQAFWANLVEHRASLYDDAVNFMDLSPSKDFTYFNFDENIRPFPLTLNEPSGRTIFAFFLSKKIVVQKRFVYDLFTMLGDVGGMSDFFFFVLSSICHLFSNKLLTTAMISQLFHQV